jgi:hypothetical protein
MYASIYATKSAMTSSGQPWNGRDGTAQQQHYLKCFAAVVSLIGGGEWFGTLIGAHTNE